MNEDWTRDEEYFAENMRRQREGLGWSREELAKRLREAGLDNMHPTTVARLENGERAVRLGEARGIAAALNIRVGYLISPPETMQHGIKILREIDEVEHDYTHVTSSANSLQDSRSRLKATLTRAEDEEVGQSLAASFPKLPERARAALRHLTDTNALEDLGVIEETHLSRYHRDYLSSERSQDDGEHQEAP